MQRMSVVAILVLLGGALLLIPASSVKGQDDDYDRVFVMNFPATQQVGGTVSVDGTVRHATLQRIKEILVSPVDPKETGLLVDGGVLIADGFTSVVLSLNGHSQGKLVKSGIVGAILIPEEEPITRAFEEEGLAHFPLEVSASLPAGSTRSFSSAPTRLVVGFPRYRVHLYNTGDKSVTVNLYAYLTN